MEALVLIVTLLVLLDIAAMRWGVDSRDGFSARRPNYGPSAVARVRHALAVVLRGAARQLDPEAVPA
jgi:hypothetical protein